MPACVGLAKRVPAAALLAVGLIAVGSPAVANASNDAVGAPGVPGASNDAVGAPGVPGGSKGGLGKQGGVDASDDDSDDTNPHPKSHRYADAVGSELTLPRVRPQAELLGGVDASAAGMPGAGGGDRVLPPSMPIVMPVGQTAAPQGGQSMRPVVPTSPIVPVAPQ
jgi:hypothetical protein